MTVLGGVPACGINQNSVVSKPPVTVTSATDAAQGLFTVGVRQWKFQPGVHQGGGFTRARRTDNNVPGELIEAEFAATRTETCLFERGQSITEAGCHLCQLFLTALLIGVNHVVVFLL